MMIYDYKILLPIFVHLYRLYYIGDGIQGDSFKCLLINSKS